MAMIYTESSLNDSEVFQGINNINPKKKVHERAIELIKSAKHLKNEDIESAYIAVRQISDSITRAAMKAFDDERIVLVYNNVPSQSITQALPFLTFKRSSGYVTYVFVDKWIRISRDGVLNMESPVLRDLLIGALLSNAIKSNYHALGSNQFLQKILMQMYTKFVMRILNRDYSIAADKIISDTLQYWINRYFLDYVMGATTYDTPENIDRLARSHVKFLDESQMEEAKRKYEESIKSNKISEFLTFIKDISPRMKGLTFGTFIGSWTQYYYAPATLAVDNIEYFIFMVMTLLAGNNIINISASEVVKETKGITNLKPELLKLLS